MIKDTLNKNSQAAPNSEEMAVLHRYFPSCFTNEGKFDIELFERQIKDSVDVIKEGYSLNFLGKDYARLIASLDTTTVICPDEVHNSRLENKNSENIYISGDNLDALHHLLKSYAGKIKCIYIDPPYNTGSDGFVYNDKFSFTKEELITKLSISEEQAAKILDLTKRGSASHSAWLMFMAPRLQLAKDLLTDDGVIFISIDDNEQANLKLICNSVLGEENFIGQIIIQTATDNNPTQINVEHEYMLCYANNKESQSYWSIRSKAAELIKEEYEKIKISCFGITDIQDRLRNWIKANKDKLPQVAHYNNVDEKGVYSSSSNSSNTKPGGYTFDIIHPITKKACPKPDYGWRWTEDTFWGYEKHGEVVWGKDESTQPHIKKRIETATEQLKSIIYEDGRASTKLLETLFGKKKIFDNPKPISVLSRIFEYVTDDDSFILDFFGGSSSSAHAILELNAINNTNRRFILVQIPELCKETSEAYKAGYKTIDEIGQKRIELAAAKIKKDTDAVIDYGFKHYTLKEVPQNTIDQMEIFDPKGLVSDENIKTKFGVPTILTTWLVRDGYGFNAPVKEIKLNDYSVWCCGQHLYMIDEGVSESDIVALIDLFNLNPAAIPSTIAVFGYSFNYHNLELVKKNLRSLKIGEDTRKLNIEVRY